MKAQTISSERTKSIILCALFVALIAICSWISVPSAVPFTLQTFAVFLTAGLLGTKRSVITILCYIRRSCICKLSGRLRCYSRTSWRLYYRVYFHSPYNRACHRQIRKQAGSCGSRYGAWAYCLLRIRYRMVYLHIYRRTYRRGPCVLPFNVCNTIHNSGYY